MKSLQLGSRRTQAAGARHSARIGFGLHFGIYELLFVPPGLHDLAALNLLDFGAAPRLAPEQIAAALISAFLQANRQQRAAAPPPPPPRVGARHLPSLALTPRLVAQRPAARACAGDLIC
jgi:hypothetical protein